MRQYIINSPQMTRKRRIARHFYTFIRKKLNMARSMLFDFKKKNLTFYYRQRNHYKCFSMINGPIQESFQILAIIEKIDKTIKVLLQLDCLKIQSNIFIYKVVSELEWFSKIISNIKNQLDTKHFQSGFIEETNLERSFFYFLDPMENADYAIQFPKKRYPFLLTNSFAQKTYIFMKISNTVFLYDRDRILNIILFFCSVKKPFNFVINHAKLNEFYISNFFILDNDEVIGKIENFLIQNSLPKLKLNLEKLSLKDFKQILRKRNLTHNASLSYNKFMQFLDMFNYFNKIETHSQTILIENSNKLASKIKVLNCIEQYSLNYNTIYSNEFEIGSDLRIYLFTTSDKIQHIRHFIETNYQNYKKLIIICEKEDVFDVLHFNTQMERTKKIHLLKISDLTDLEQILDASFKTSEILV